MSSTRHDHEIDVSGTSTVTGREFLTQYRADKIALSPHGHVVCYLGYLREDVHGDPFLYAVQVGLRHDPPHDMRRAEGYVRLSQGTLWLDRWPEVDGEYRLFPGYVVYLPGLQDGGYFGVIRGETQEEDQKLTHDIFGTTFKELLEFLEIFGRVVHVGIPDDPIFRVMPTLRYPRITVSKQRDNQCDLTDSWIPRGFPYIAFCDTQHLYGHVSFHGFYRHLGFVCSTAYGGRSNAYRKLLAAGANQAVLDCLINAASCSRNPVSLGHL